MKKLMINPNPFKRFLLFTVIFFLSFTFCFSQNPLPVTNEYLMVVDVQSYFYANKPFESEALKMVKEVNRLIGKFDPSKIIYIKAGGKVLSISGKGISTSIVYPDLDSNLILVNQNIFTKIEGDAFRSSELLSFIESNGVKEIVVVGLLAEKCITHTSLGGVERGFKISLIPEAIIGSSSKKKAKAMKRMAEKGVSIKSSY